MSEIRERWASRPAFIMAAVGSAVGLGNLWRFPYIAATNGGGAFLIPYLVAILTAGIPLMILEYGLGQATQRAAPAAFRKLNRKFEWVGWFALGVSTVIVIYYAAVMAWCWRYLFASINLEWGQTQEQVKTFYSSVIARSGNFTSVGSVQTPVLAALMATWAMIYWIIYRGVHRVGKVVMLTVPLPAILLLVMVIRGITLPGSGAGLNYYLEPTWEKLRDPSTWLAAYAQVFFSLSLGFGILIAYASYLPRESDVSNSAFITTLADAIVSYIAGFAVFSVLGYLAIGANADFPYAAKELVAIPENVETSRDAAATELAADDEQIVGASQAVKKVAEAGPALVFKVYPHAINRLPTIAGVNISPLFGIIFFITLLSLGIDSAFSLVEAVVAGLHDKWPQLRRSALTAAICIASFFLGIIFITDSGLAWLDVVDHWCNSYGLVTVGLLECIVIGWFVGTKQLEDSINAGAEIRVGLWWRLCIKFITPGILLALLLLELHKELFVKRYEGYETWALIVGGWCVIVAALVGSLLLMRTKEPEALE